MQNLELSRDLRELLKCFLSHEVEFLIIGGHAVSYHGYPRFTKDLDVWIQRSEANALKIVSALREFGFDFEGLSPQMFSDCFPRSLRANIDGLAIPIISKADLVLNKIATARPQDLADADQLQKPS